MKLLFFLLALIGLSSVIATAEDFENAVPVLGDCNPACQWFIRDSKDALVENWKKKGNRITQYEYERWKKNNFLVCDGECDGAGPCTHSSFPGEVENVQGEMDPTTWHICACAVRSVR